MAMSKALQAREWWDSIHSASGKKYLIFGNLPNRARKQTTVSDSRSSYHSLASTLNQEIKATAHAEYRQAQRNLSDQDINYTLLHGQSYHKAGAVIVHLRWKDIPSADRADSRCQKLVGTTVVLTTGGRRRVLTAYRNRNSGLRHIKRKPDRSRN